MKRLIIAATMAGCVLMYLGIAFAGVAVQPRPQMVALDPFLVKLADEPKVRYIQIALEVQVASKNHALIMDEKKAVTRDAVIHLLSSKTYNDIDTVEKKLALKDELFHTFRQSLGDGVVEQVFITDMIIQ